jgi:hypothetical protein
VPGAAAQRRPGAAGDEAEQIPHGDDGRERPGALQPAELQEPQAQLSLPPEVPGQAERPFRSFTGNAGRK